MKNWNFKEYINCCSELIGRISKYERKQTSDASKEVGSDTYIHTHKPKYKFIYWSL
jgi:hypothetical protein